VAKEEFAVPSHANYDLKAVIIHLGKSVHSGHYVAYVRTEQGWVLFNDERVTRSAHPVLGKGYIYLYEGV
jgi:ubiquitin carboxyl-terminal hydrolase 5/13